jgi:hypothetical protein
MQFLLVILNRTHIIRITKNSTLPSKFYFSIMRLTLLSCFGVVAVACEYSLASMFNFPQAEIDAFALSMLERTDVAGLDSSWRGGLCPREKLP